MCDEPKKRRWWARAWVWWGPLVVLFVLYPLSMGPAMWIVRSNQQMDVYCAVFAPVRWVRDRSETINDALSWYLEIWDPIEGYMDK